MKSIVKVRIKAPAIVNMMYIRSKGQRVLTMYPHVLLDGNAMKSITPILLSKEEEKDVVYDKEISWWKKE